MNYKEALEEKVKNLEYTLIGVMHSVDKWLEGDELNQHEVKRAIRMREKVLQIIEKQQAEIDKLKTETVEALEIQIPKKINSDNGFGGRCPVCGYYIVKSIFSSKGHKYCSECGQAIDWEVSE